MSQIHMKPEVRRESILEAAAILAETDHYRSLSRDQVADYANTAAGNVTRLFGDMKAFRRALVQHAIDTENKQLIVQAISIRDPAVKGCPTELRRAALDGHH